MKNIKRWLAAGAVIAVVATGVTLTRDHVETKTAQAAPLVLQGGDAIADVVEKVLPSVVNISTTKVIEARGPASSDPLFNDPRSPFFGRRGKRQGSSLGSGVIVSSDGYVVTNNHVIANADSIKVSLSDGRELDAKLVGGDPQSDLALLKLEGKLGKLQPMTIGKSGDMRLGEVVLAIGNPFGVGQSVTMGIVSAKGRSGMGIVGYEDFIQTDAAINPGNSGGALINTKGQLIGINTAILSRSGGYQGIGFAIPTDMAGPIMKDLMDDGKVARGWLGVSIDTINRDFAEGKKLAPNTKGVWVGAVVPRSPAARAGLREGDIVIALDKKKVTTSAQLSNAVAMAGPDKKVKLDIVRNGAKRALEVKLGHKAKAKKAQEYLMRERERRLRRRR